MLRYFFTPGSPLGMTEGVRSQTPPREKGVLKSPQAFQNPKLKIYFPLQRRRPPPVAETGRSC